MDIIEDKVFVGKHRFRELIVFDFLQKSKDKNRIEFLPSYVTEPKSDEEKVYSKLYLEFLAAKNRKKPI